MKVMALDIGTTRIGVAVSDPLGITAQPFGVIKRAKNGADLREIAEICSERTVEVVVIGLPLSLKGHENISTNEARKVGSDLAKLNPELKIVFQDERFTTAEAERALIEGGVRRKKRKQVIDQTAAVLILRTWLDRVSDVDIFEDVT